MMIKELVIISGKGGTGKTSVTASLAHLARGKTVIADCDVDAADLHLLIPPSKTESESFFSGWEPEIEADKCVGCGKCAELCRYDAIAVAKNNAALFNPFACEGCGVCSDHCPEQAIKMVSRLCGELFSSQTAYGPMIHAKLGVGGENSGKLVAEVRKKSKTIAENKNSAMIITDGPPGIGCPVIASLTGATQALIVTEPTVSGLHDTERVLKLCGHFKIPAYICVNKCDINPDVTGTIKQMAERHNAPCLAEIPYDPTVTTAQIAAEPVVAAGNSPAAAEIKKLWRRIIEND